MDTGRYLTVPGENETETDKYTASIELSNACRQFYKSRLEAAHCIKSKWQSRRANRTCCDDSSNDNDRPSDNDHSNVSSSSTTQPPRQRNSIDEAMDKLRSEMTSLMDQDLSLMKQLLTLNETIEDLKWQRRYYYNPRSLPSSSADLHRSDCSVSDTEMYESDDDSILVRPSPTSTATTTTMTSTCQTPLVRITPASSTSPSPRRKHALVYGSGHVTSAHAHVEKSCDDSERVGMSETPSVKVFHGEQDSFDSGFHEASSEEEAVV